MPTRLFALILAPLVLLLAGCGNAAQPALWRVDAADAPQGGEPAGYLFGTIHALPRGTNWHGETLDKALDRSGVLMVEIANLDKDETMRVFQSLAVDRSLPPLSERVSPVYRDELGEVLAEAGAEAETFHYVETWAAALTLGSMLQARSSLDPEHGVDKALVEGWQGRPLIGLETTEEQLRIFDQLSGDEQQDLLESLVIQAETMEPETMSDAWASGDADKLAGLMDMGMEASPNLRAALLGRRNARWIGRIVAQLQDGRTPFVAVGAGHMGGPDGLIALLNARGWTVTRIQ